MPFLLSPAPAWTSAVIALHLVTQAAQSAILPRDFQRPIPPESARLQGPGHRYANLAPGTCKKLLRERDIHRVFQPQGPTSGIATPLRLAGSLSGVEFQVPAPKFSFGRLDCRLALVLIDWAPLLAEQGIEKVRIDGFYRRGARLPGRRSKSQHAYGLAVDLVSLRGKSPRMAAAAELDVKEHFLGKRGQPPCGPEARLNAPPNATAELIEQAALLRSVVCEAGRRGYFHHILTPNYNKAHESHLHLDIKRDNQWFSLD